MDPACWLSLGCCAPLWLHCQRHLLRPPLLLLQLRRRRRRGLRQRLRLRLGQQLAVGQRRLARWLRLFSYLLVLLLVPLLVLRLLCVWLLLQAGFSLVLLHLGLW